MTLSLWNLICASAALLPWHLSNFQSNWKTKHLSNTFETLQDFTIRHIMWYWISPLSLLRCYSVQVSNLLPVFYLRVYSLHHNVLPTLQSIPLMTNGPLYPITQDSSCHSQHTMPRSPWSFPWPVPHSCVCMNVCVLQWHIYPNGYILEYFVPIYKKGPKHLAVNYRPVSLTCICSKLMEHIMVSQISRHLDTHKILLKNQHGFLSRLSCETQLLEFVQELHDNLNNGQQVDAIIMDFSKAFDKVAHNRLLHKLDNYGISGKANRWIADFLSGRSQQVVVEGCASGKVPVTSGVPQGSVLGPVLFLVYINDIADKTSSAVRLFADDTIIYRPITTVNDQTTLQKDLNALDHWSRVWQMEFHPSKCQTLHITRSPKPLLTNYNLYGQQIEAVDSAKYLGVTLTPDLRWNNHVHSVRNKSSATMRLLQRNMRISSTQIKTRAYNTYVRPQLEYAATIWDPHTKQNIKKLEQVQRTAARWTLGRYRNTSSVSDMLNELGWRSLEQRRADARLVMMYKLRNNMLAIDPSPYLKPAQGSIARVYPHRYITLDTNTKIYARSFYPNTIRQWNCLPPHVALAPTLNAFKRQVCQLQHPHWDHG